MSRVLGVDGARGGWSAVLVDAADTEGEDLHWLRLQTIAEALECDVDVVAIDMPIGLPSAP